MRLDAERCRGTDENLADHILQLRTAGNAVENHEGQAEFRIVQVREEERSEWQAGSRADEFECRDRIPDTVDRVPESYVPIVAEAQPRSGAQPPKEREIVGGGPKRVCAFACDREGDGMLLAIVGRDRPAEQYYEAAGRGPCKLVVDVSDDGWNLQRTFVVEQYEVCIELHTPAHKDPAPITETVGMAERCARSQSLGRGARGFSANKDPLQHFAASCRVDLERGREPRQVNYGRGAAFRHADLDTRPRELDAHRVLLPQQS
jgi:hypothetical protein